MRHQKSLFIYNDVAAFEEEPQVSAAQPSRPSGMLIYATVLISFATAFSFSYPVNGTNTSVDAFRKFLNETTKLESGHAMSVARFSKLWPAVFNAFIIGAIVGSIIMPVSADKLGRRIAVIISLIPFIMGSVAQLLGIVYLKHNVLAIGRFVSGITAGMMSSVASVYLTECAPVQLRGVVGSCQALFSQWLTILSMSIGLPDLLGDYDRLVYLTGIQLVPGVFTFVGAFFLPETPKFLLIVRNDLQAAKSSIAVMHGPSANLDEVINSIRKEADERSFSIFRTDLWIELFQRYRWNLAIGVVGLVGLMSTGVPAIFGFSTLLFENVGVHPSYAPYLSLGMIFISCLITTVSTFTIEMVPRRSLLLWSFFGVISSGLIYVIFASIFVYTNHGFWCTVIASSGLFSQAALIGGGIGVIPWFLTDEVVPFSCRSAAQMIAVSLAHITSVISTSIFLPLFHSINAFAFLVVYTSSSTLCIAFLYQHMPETRKREVHEIANEIVLNHQKAK